MTGIAIAVVVRTAAADVDISVVDPDIVDVASDGTDDETFPDVVLVGDERGFYCSGVLIDERRVLTAGHCVAATRVGFGHTSKTARGEQVSVRARHPHLDAAVLTLAHPASVPVRARRRANDTTPPLGLIRFIGFGVTDRLRLTGFGTKRQLDIDVDGWGCTRPRSAITGCNPADELLVRGGQGNDTCLGDSGGPVFERVDDGWRLLAITSRGMRPRKVICGEGGIYIRVDRIATWLKGGTQ